MKIKKIISAVMAMAMTASALTAFSAFADNDETGNMKSSADEVTFNEWIEGNLKGDGDNDWYHFTTDTVSKVNIEINFSNESNNLIYTYYEIIDANNDNNVIMKNNYINNHPIVSYTNVFYFSAGDYYVHLCSNGTDSDYSMQVKTTPLEESFTGTTNNALSKATPIEFDTQYSGIIGHNDESDYYTFNVEEEGLVTFNFDGNMKDVDWKILNGKKDTDDNIVQSGTFSQLEGDDSISVIKSYVMTPGKFTLALTKHDTPLASNSNDAEILAKILNDSGYGDYTFSLEYNKDYNDTTVNGAFAVADINKDNHIDANDASAILSYYAYLSTGGTETDMSVWMETEFLNS